MKFGKYLDSKCKPEWRDFYLDYKKLKDLIKSSASLTEGAAAYSPRTTSLTVVRSNNTKEAAEEKFFLTLETEVRRWRGVAAAARRAGGADRCDATLAARPARPARLWAPRAAAASSCMRGRGGAPTPARLPPPRAQVKKISGFTDRLVTDLRKSLTQLNTQVRAGSGCRRPAPGRAEHPSALRMLPAAG
jgi:hypothetical protein